MCTMARRAINARLIDWMECMLMVLLNWIVVVDIV